MRLSCASCGALYEIDDRAIPEAGRDVQCSACGHVWFARTSGFADESLTLPVEGAPFEAAGFETPRFETDVDWIRADDPQADDSRPNPRLTNAPAVDPRVLEVLREEAAFEARARAGEARPLEYQGELGLEAGDRPADAPPAEWAVTSLPSASPPQPAAGGAVDGAAVDGEVAAGKVAGGESSQAAPVDFGRPAASGAAPSALRVGGAAASAQRPAAPAQPQRGRPPSGVATLANWDRERDRRDFGRGFAAAILIAVAVLGLYLLAPEIARELPATAPALDAYVAGIDGGRDWLDGTVTRLAADFRALIGRPG